jgi:hypothetical protein
MIGMSKFKVIKNIDFVGLTKAQAEKQAKLWKTAYGLRTQIKKYKPKIYKHSFAVFSEG